MTQEQALEQILTARDALDVYRRGFMRFVRLGSLADSLKVNPYQLLEKYLGDTPKAQKTGNATVFAITSSGLSGIQGPIEEVLRNMRSLESQGRLGNLIAVHATLALAMVRGEQFEAEMRAGRDQLRDRIGAILPSRSTNSADAANGQPVNKALTNPYNAFRALPYWSEAMRFGLELLPGDGVVITMCDLPNLHLEIRKAFAKLTGYRWKDVVVERGEPENGFRTFRVLHRSQVVSV